MGPPLRDAEEYAAVIAESGRHLLAIISGILDVARAETNRLTLAEEEAEIARAVAFRLGTIEKMARRAQIDCQAEIPDDLQGLSAMTRSCARF